MEETTTRRMHVSDSYGVKFADGLTYLGLLNKRDCLVRLLPIESLSSSIICWAFCYDIYNVAGRQVLMEYTDVGASPGYCELSFDENGPIRFPDCTGLNESARRSLSLL